MIEDNRKILSQYLPKNSIDEIHTIQRKYNFQLKITKPRKSKLGDFKVITRHQTRISVNGNLNRYEFLIVLLHEIAHLIIWKKYRRKVNPHGKEWKLAFRELLMQFVNLKSFTTDIENALSKCLNKSVLSTIKCEELARELKKETPALKTIFLRDIPDNSEFKLNVDKTFIKLQKIRTRYRCKEVNSGKIYTIHPLAEVVWYKVI